MENPNLRSEDLMAEELKNISATSKSSHTKDLVSFSRQYFIRECVVKNNKNCRLGCFPFFPGVQIW